MSSKEEFSLDNQIYNDNLVYKSDDDLKTKLNASNENSIKNANSKTNYPFPIKTRYDVKSTVSKPLQNSKGSESSTVYVKPNSNHTSYADGEYERASDAESASSESQTREQWGGQFEFLLSCIGYAVGLGTIWRFPYLCYKNGGGAFLIPYLIFLVLVGIPLFYLEFNVGQYTSQGPFMCWKMAPIFKGLGISMNTSSFYFCIYYNILIGYALYYLVLSFQSPLPWSKCDPSWASQNCTDFGDLVKCDEADVFKDPSGMCFNNTNSAKEPIGWWSMEKRSQTTKPVLPSQDYYYNYILNRSPGLEDSGEIVWKLVLVLGVAWILVFFCIFKGIKSSGKVVYFTSVFPFVVLIILGINGWTLKGSEVGMLYFFKPDFLKLTEANVWFDAAVQVFFSMGTCTGGLITLSSYNKFRENTLRNTFIITLTSSITAIFSGFVVFSYIGYLAHVTNQRVEDVVSSGSGLSFIVFPFAATSIPGAPFWSVIFFIMVLTLGLDSQFATLEIVITSILDGVPRARKHKKLLIFGMCVALFLLGLTFTTRGGSYWVEILDKFSSGWAVLMVGATECVCIGWVYGYNKFRKDIGLMIGDKYANCFLSWYWAICWKFVCPILLFGLAMFSIIQYKPLQVDDYVYPEWANLIGHLMTISILSGTVGWAIYMVIDALFINKRSLKTLFTPEEEWGPLLAENRRLAVHLDNLKNLERSKSTNMSRSQPEMCCSSNRSPGATEPERNLMDLISNWKTKSRMDSQYDRIKKILFSFNQKPTDFKPTDFFPPIPDCEIASDSEEKTIDRKTSEIDKERKSLSKRKLDYESLAEIEPRSDNQNQSASQSQDLNVSKCLNENENEKQRRQPISNDFNDLEQLSPINSPTHTNRNLIKLNRASLLKQLQNDENTQSTAQVSNKKSTNEANRINKIIDLLSLSKKSINQSSSSLVSAKSPAKSLNTQDDSINKMEQHAPAKEPRRPKNKSAEKIEHHSDKENNNQTSANEEMSIFNPPTPPPVQQQNNHVETLCNQPSTRSSITITKRRSAEPLRDILVDLSNVSAKPKILSKQKSTGKLNQSMSDDQTELLSSQSNTFIRRKSTLGNKTSNSTVNSSTSASILFKPVSRQTKTTTQDFKQLPPPPLFASDKPHSSSEHETSNDESSRKVKQKKTRNKKSAKKTLKKQQTETKESEESKSQTDACDLQQHDKALNTQQAHNHNLAEIEKNADVDVDFQVQLNQKSSDISKITCFFKKIASNHDVTNEKTISKQADQSLSPIIAKTIEQKSAQKNQILTQKIKNTKTRQPLKNIKNQEPISKAKTKKNSHNEFGYFNNNKTVAYEPKMVDECPNDPTLALRRSKRAKIDKNSQPIYGYEEISDYQGNKCIVRKVVGTKDKIGLKINMELIRINHLNQKRKTGESKKKSEKKGEKKKSQENKNVDIKQAEISTASNQQQEMDSNKQIDDHLINDPIEQLNRIEPQSEPQFDQANEQHQDVVVDQDCLEVDNLAANNETLSISLNSNVNNVNNSMEFVYSTTDASTRPIHLYFFHKNIEKKIFQPYSKGVQISPISDLTGILRINGTCSTKTNLHDFAVNYFVQNGSFLFSLNGHLSIHYEKDVIYIPKNTPYKIKNLSDNQENFAHIYFRFEN